MDLKNIDDNITKLKNYIKTDLINNLDITVISRIILHNQ